MSSADLVRTSVEPDGADVAAVVMTVEGVWGAGKTTVARRLGDCLKARGLRVNVVHYGPYRDVIAPLSDFLERTPLRRRAGVGGFAQRHHATVDVFLRLAREAYHHRCIYQPAVMSHDIVVIDHGVYSKLAYALAVLEEQHPDARVDELLARLRGCVRPWFLEPDRAVFLDVPWPLARERAIARGCGGGVPGSLERLLFLPRFDAAYRHVLAAYRDRVARVAVAGRSVDDVVAEVEGDALGALRRVARRDGGRV